MYVSRHGDKRIRKRVGIPRKAVAKHLKDVLEKGKRRQEFSGRLRRYLDRRFEKSMQGRKDCVDVILYGRMIYIIAGETIVTTYPLPPKIRERRRFHYAKDEEDAAE